MIVSVVVVPDGCGFADEGGTCEVCPQACPEVLDPVCGCDGATYDNGCDAAAFGIDVKHAGSCS